ncbi:MAG: gas vesicle protein GvpO [Actinomycetes bacterium]
MATRTTVVQVVKGIKDDIRVVTGFDALSVTSLEKGEAGWEGRVEVLELKRVPDTQDLIGVYDVSLNADGDLVSWDRAFTRVKGQPMGNEDASD